MNEDRMSNGSTTTPARPTRPNGCAGLPAHNGAQPERDHQPGGHVVSSATPFAFHGHALPALPTFFAHAAALSLATAGRKGS